MVPTAQLKPRNETQKNGGYLTINYSSLLCLWVQSAWIWVTGKALCSTGPLCHAAHCHCHHRLCADRLNEALQSVFMAYISLSPRNTSSNWKTNRPCNTYAWSDTWAWLAQQFLKDRVTYWKGMLNKRVCGELSAIYSTFFAKCVSRVAPYCFSHGLTITENYIFYYIF